MATSRFRANVVFVEESRDAFVVGLSEDEKGDGAYITFQTGLTPPDQQDVATGMDSYCMLDEDDAVEYGGLASAALADGTLTLVLTEAAAEEFGIESDARTIEIDVPASDVPRLAEGLRRVLTYGNADKQPQLSGI